jgi:enediyne biosynthesis protein E3
VTLTFGKILKPFFRLSADAFPKLAAERYGQQDDMDKTWLTFEPVARNLVGGFQLALDDCRFEVLVPRLNAIDVEWRGIAYEGAGMGLMLLDSLGPWKKRLKAFIDGPGAAYDWLLYIGAGLVLPRVPRRPDGFLAQLDPFLRWFVMDGYGFYEGFFSGRRSIDAQVIPARITGYGRRAFDHGLGRSVWFSTGANVERIVATITAFPEARQADLWGGIGLACAYAAGVVDREAIKILQTAAGPYRAQMAAGAAVAAKFRMQTGGSAAHTDLACEVLCGRSSKTVAHIANRALTNLPPDGVEPAYEIWRQRLADQFATLVESVPEQKEAKP